MTITIGVVQQISKQLFESLRDCKAKFRYSSNYNQFDILEVDRMYKLLDDDNLAITFHILGNENTNTIYIHKDNILSLDILRDIR